MTEFLIYQGKTAVALAVFYMFYRLLLSKETFHRFNRIVLLGTAALSFVLPLCVITIKKVVTLPYTPASDIDMANDMIGNMAVAVAENMDKPVWPIILCGIFGVGALTVLIHTVVSVIKVKSMIASGEHTRLEDGYTLVITDTDTAPFSWMKYIVLSKEDYESGYSQILTHEKAHISLRHSWDILFVDLITALQWFNPAIWMLKADLRAIHEFEADDAVLRSGANVKEYQYLLIRKAVSKSGYSVANSFNHSTLKARITMMLNKKSSRSSAWKALYVIPLVGISLAATAETKVDYQYEGQQTEVAADVLDGKDTKSFKEKNLNEARILVNEENGTVTMIYYGLQGDDFKEYKAEWIGLDLTKNVYMANGAIVTEELYKADADKDNVITLNAYLKNGNKVRAVVSPERHFVSGTAKIEREEADPNVIIYDSPSDFAIENVEESNKVSKVEVDGTEDLVIVVNGKRMPKDFDLNTIDPNTIASISVDKTEDAIAEFGEEAKNGVVRITVDPEKANEEKPVPDIYINGKKATSEEVAALPPNPKGSIAADGTVWIVTEDETAEEPVADPVQNKAPSFQGGSNAKFQQWVYSQIKYPEGVTKEGMVSVSFTVTETGKVTDVKVLRGFDPACDAEAVRAISMSPDWEPGLSEGKPVAIKMMLPVHFKK